MLFNINHKKLSVISMAILGLLVSGVVSFNAQARTIVVGVTSNKPVKTIPVLAAFSKLFKDDVIVIRDFKADSGIADSPVTQEWGIAGAMNRIKNAKKEAGESQPSIDYWVSIENYIEDSKANDDQWIDRGAVVIQDVKTEAFVIELSEPVAFPSKYALMAKEETEADGRPVTSGYSISIGKVIQREVKKENNIDLDDGNWHKHSMFGGEEKSRDLILKRATLKAVRKIAVHIQSNL